MAVFFSIDIASILLRINYVSVVDLNESRFCLSKEWKTSLWKTKHETFAHEAIKVFKYQKIVTASLRKQMWDSGVEAAVAWMQNANRDAVHVSIVCCSD
jgi:hypothetical protein